MMNTKINNPLDPRNSLAEELSIACSNGDLDKVKYMLNRGINKPLLEFGIFSALSSACRYGHLEIVKYLLTSDEFKPSLTIENDYHSCLSSACGSGQLEIVQFILMSPFIKNHADIEYVSPNYPQTDTPLASACAAGHLDIIKFLLYSKKLNKNSQLHAYDDIAFRRCVEAKQENVLNYFIYNLHFVPTKKTYELLEKNINRYDIQCIKSLVTKRDLIAAIGEIEFCEDMKQIKI